MKKRFITFFMAIVLAAGLLASCAQPGGDLSGKAYAAQDFAGNTGEGILAPAVNSGGELVVASQAEGAPAVLTTYDTSGNKKSEVTTDVTDPVSHFALDGKDTAYLLAGSTVHALDPSGKTVNSISVEDVLSQQAQSFALGGKQVSGEGSKDAQEDQKSSAAQPAAEKAKAGPVGFNVTGFAASSDGSIFISSMGSGVTQIDSTGKQVRTYSQGGINLICMNEKEQLMIYSMGQGSPAITTYDTQSGSETAKLEASLANPSMLFYDKQAKRTLYMNGDGIYPVNEDGSTDDALITLTDFSLSNTSHGFAGFAMDGVGTIYIASYENSSENGGPNVAGGVVVNGGSDGSFSMATTGAKADRIDRLALVDASTIPQKKVLTIAGISAGPNVNAAIDAFQKAHPDYRVELKTYSNEIVGMKQAGDEVDLTSMIQQFNTDVIADNNADIYILDNLPYYKYIDKGLLADLGPMLEASGLDMSKYYGNIFDACKVDGALYTLPTAFSFDMLAGKEGNMPAGDTPSTDDFFNAANNLPAGIAALPGEDATQAFTEYMKNNYTYLVDQAAKTARFGTPEFINLLNQFKSLADTKMSGKSMEDASPQELVGDGTLAFTPMQFRGIQELAMIKAFAGDDVKLSGMPSMEQGAYNFTPRGLYGINASSQNKEIAWEFIQSLITDDVQSDMTQMNGFPVNRTALQNIINQTIEDGSNANTRMVIGTPTKQVEVKPLSKEEYDTFAANIDKLNRVSAPDANIVNILNEELPSFFSGQKSAEDVAALIQNRVETILNE